MEFFRLSFKNSSLTALLLITMISSAFADTTVPTTASPLAGVQAALDARDHTLADISIGDSRAASQAALNTLVAEGVSALLDNGDRRLARRYEDEWNQNFSSFLTDTRILDLGDHKPLSLWLSTFYDKLEERLGYSTIHNGLLGDIYLMNFAIPVVFTPKGEWRTPVTPNRDWVEYRKHFIPFANVVTYWGVKIACNQIMKKQEAGKQGKKLCEKVATKLRQVMGRYVAPKISDFIFNKSNGADARLVITAQDLVYGNAQALLSEIESEGSL